MFWKTKLGKVDQFFTFFLFFLKFCLGRRALFSEELSFEPLCKPRGTEAGMPARTQTHTCKSTWGQEAVVCGHSPGAGPPWWRSTAWPTARSAFSAAGRHISCSPSPGAWRPPLRATGVWAVALSLPPPPHRTTRRSCSWRQSHCLQEPQERTCPCAVTRCVGRWAFLLFCRYSCSGAQGVGVRCDPGKD